MKCYILFFFINVWIFRRREKRLLASDTNRIKDCEYEQVVPLSQTISPYLSPTVTIAHTAIYNWRQFIYPRYIATNPLSKQFHNCEYKL